MYTPNIMNFNIIGSVCKKGGIGYKYALPWINSTTYDKLFSKLTHGNGNNALLMGLNTYNNVTISYYGPFHGRYNLVLSNKNYNDLYSPYKNLEYFPNVDSVISNCMKNKYDEVWIVGGEKIFSYFLTQSKYPIKNIYLNYINKEYDCDAYMPINFIQDNKYEILDTRIINNVEQSIIKFNYNRIPF